MHQIISCPICKSTNLTNFLTCKDHTVSHETFSIVKCINCTLGITTPQPLSENLGRYYESENYISHSNKSQSFFDKLYQLSRHLTLRWKTNLIQKNNIETSVHPTLLDYGCGTGEFLHACQQKQFKVAGVEPSARARTHANEKTRISVAETISQVNSTFDVITLWHVLEHVEDLNEKLHDLSALLNKNGTMFIAVPNHHSIDAKHYKQLWAGYDVPRHLWHFNEKSMTQLITRHHLKLIKIIPMKLDAFYVSMLSEQYRSGKRNIFTMFNGVRNGLKSNLCAGKNNYSSQIFVIRK